jgi:phosphatidylinositol phospholipase C beta
VKKLISEQTTQWTQMMEKQRKEEWELQKTQLEGSREEIKNCIPTVQAQQVKLLEIKHEK